MMASSSQPRPITPREAPKGADRQKRPSKKASQVASAVEAEMEALRRLVGAAVITDEPAPTLSSLDSDAVRCICTHLDGRGLVALAKAARLEPSLRAASRDEVHRRECSVATSVAKAKAAGEATQGFLPEILIRKLVGKEPAANLERPMGVEELSRLNALVGKHSVSGRVPLSELIDGSLRRCTVGIIGSDHRPPPAAHVAELVTQCFACAQRRLPLEPEDVGKQPDGSLSPVTTAKLEELIGFVYWRLVWIHPFVDGNGRTAHLAALTIAMRAIVQHKENREKRKVPDESATWSALLSHLRPTSLSCMEPLIKCAKFFEFRRLEMRSQLVGALREADAAWAAIGVDERRRLLVEPARGVSGPMWTAWTTPWKELGQLLLRDVWGFVGWSLKSATTRKMERTLRYRWTNDLGGGDYSTGITDTAGNGATPTYVNLPAPGGGIEWRAFDERKLLPLPSHQPDEPAPAAPPQK